MKEKLQTQPSTEGSWHEDTARGQRLEATGEAGQILPSRRTEGTKPADTWVLGLPPEP